MSEKNAGEYALVRWALGQAGTVSLNNEEMRALQRAADVIKKSCYVEEKFDLLFSNYSELEEQLVTITIRSMLRPNFEHAHMQQNKLEINRRFVNLLTSCCLYVDHVAHHLSEIFPKEEGVKKFRDFLGEVYKENIEYRLMEAMRNYVQHRGLPVQSSMYPAKWIGEGESRAIEHNLGVYFNIEEVVADGKFKSSVAKELLEGESDIEIKAVARKYVECYVSCQKFVREMMSGEVVAASSIIREYANKYPQEDKSDFTGLCVVKVQTPSIENNGRYWEKLFFLPMDGVLYLESFAKKHHLFSNLSKSYLSTRKLDYPGAPKITAA